LKGWPKWCFESAKRSLESLRNRAKCSPIMLYFLEHLTFSATQFGDLAAGKVPKVAKGLSGITRKVRKRGLNGAKIWSKVLKKRSLIAFFADCGARAVCDWSGSGGETTEEQSQVPKSGPIRLRSRQARGHPAEKASFLWVYADCGASVTRAASQPRFAGVASQRVCGSSLDGLRARWRVG
jgi:hypothetical protein